MSMPVVCAGRTLMKLPMPQATSRTRGQSARCFQANRSSGSVREPQWFSLRPISKIRPLDGAADGL